MRYQFRPLKEKPGYVAVVDLQMNEVVIEMWIEHAQVISMMYLTQSKKSPALADEFMYGHLMGMTYAMLHADKYPKIEVVREEGRVTMRLIEPDGTFKDYDTANPIGKSRERAMEMLEKAGVQVTDGGKKQ